MKKISTILITIAIICCAALSASAKPSRHIDKYPLIGAQIFVEPGQSDEQIDSFFAAMEKAGMEVGRIRLFGVHVLKPDGSYDFSLYDKAFDAAARHHVRMFITLFPPTDELSDVGGFKFPRTREHLEQILDYTRQSVNHFKSHPATYCWVLQNEPGLGGPINPSSTPLADEMFESFCKENPYVRDSWLKGDFRREQFTRVYTTWYLKTIADLVKECDPLHGRHINPHQILGTLPEYEFDKFDFLTSLGSSMHLSWHFSYFNRDEYQGGIALMSDIIHTAASDKGAWVTEMQGGPVTASGNTVLCPSPMEMKMNIWTAICSGMDGVLFWTLNARRSVQEAGEWALLEFTGDPSERMQAAAQTISEITEHKAFFDAAEPEKSEVAILYNKESFWIQSRNAIISNDKENAGRGGGVVAQSMASCYTTLSSMGLSPRVADMDLTDFEGIRYIILPDMVSLTDAQISKLEGFVKKGGVLLLSGMTGYYDENMSCRFMEPSPLDPLTGARMREFAVGEPYHLLSCGIYNHIWMGKLKPVTATSLLCEGEDCIATEHKYGAGRVIWFPSMIELGAWHTKAECTDGAEGLRRFYSSVLAPLSQGNGIYLEEPCKGIVIRTLKSGSKRMSLVINKNESDVALRVHGVPSTAQLVSGDAAFVKDGTMRLNGNTYALLFY